jgi:hypothetical protein
MRLMFPARRLPASIAFAAAMALSQAALADILIVSSSAPGLTPGMQLDDTAKLEIPSGAKVRVLLPSGATLQITGAASRTVRDITKGEPMVETVWAKARELFATGGVDQSRVGATRSFRPAPAPAAISNFAWSVIGADASGNVCVERGARIVLERPAGGRAADLTLIDTAKNAKAVVSFGSEAPRSEWPASLTPSADTTYQITAAGVPVRQIKLRFIEKGGTSDASALRSLLDNDCRAQAKAWAKG